MQPRAAPGHAPWSFSVPPRSRNASSIDTYSTRGIGCSISSPPPARPHYTRHIGPDELCTRPSRQPLEHRHCRAHAIEPRHGAGGEYDTAPASPDNHWSLGKIRTPAFFDSGAKGAAIDAIDRCVKHGSANLARLAARATPVTSYRRCSKDAAIAAQRGHPNSSARHSQAAPRTPLELP
jgi:hypothetical protein